MKKEETPKRKKPTKKETNIKIEEKIVKEIKIEEVQVEEEKSQEKKSPKKKMKIKTSDLILVLGLVLVIVLGCFVMKNENDPGYELPLEIKGEVGLHQLTYKEYKDKVDNDEAFVLIIERATCSHCVSYMPVAEKFANDNSVPMYYVDTDTFSYEEWNEFENTNTYLKRAKGSWGTPTTLVLAGNQSVYYVVGETSEETLKKLYNEYFDITLE